MSVHVVTRRNGKKAYVVRWREAGRNRGRSFRRKSDADLFDAERTRRRQLGALAQITSRQLTLDDWKTTRWEPQHATLLEPSTRDHYSRVYARHIAPTLGDTLLLDINVRALREWQAHLLANGRSPHAVIKARTLLSSILRHAAESEAIPANPLRLVRPPRRDRSDEVNPLTPLQVEQIRAHLTRRDRTIVSVLAYSGLRPGELRGLRWPDVRERTLLVQRAIRPDGTAKRTKSRRARTVDLLAELRDDLHTWSLASPAGARGPVFPNRNGNHWTEDQWEAWRRDTWRPACTAAGLPHTTRPYDLRHSFASLLLAAGHTIHDVARQLGHAPDLTLNVYGHVYDEYRGGDPIDPDTEIRKARETFTPSSSTTTNSSEEKAA